MALTSEEREDLIKYRLQRAHETVKEAVDVYSLDHYVLAINRLYYALFYAFSSLLIKDGHNANTHAGVRAIVGKNYVLTGIISRKEGKLFSDLFSMRHTGDYGDSYNIGKEDVEYYINPTKDLVSKIANLVINN